MARLARGDGRWKSLKGKQFGKRVRKHQIQDPVCLGRRVDEVIGLLLSDYSVFEVCIYGRNMMAQWDRNRQTLEL